MVRISFVLFGSLAFLLILFLSAQDSIKRISVNSSGADSLNNKNEFYKNIENKCGPIALKMIFDHYKIPSTLSEIETKVGLGKKGTSMLALKEMSDSKGLYAEGWRLTLEDFLKTSFPVIIFVNGDHYVVADSVLSDRLFIRDPTLGRLTLSIKVLPKMWKGETLVFQTNKLKK
jgi:ABC-type bacteriocin/lantibiotic exporter with double-glycine peptidase domain